MSKPTDNEIIKAFEICTNSSLDCSDGCPYHKKEIGHYCLHRMNRDVLDLINSQKAEIERYKETVGDLVIRDNEVVALKDSKETKYIHKDTAETFKRMAVKQAKAEAKRELARELLNPSVGQKYISKNDAKTIVYNLAKYY